jgi:hypothetical protein
VNPDDPRHGTTNGYTNLRCRCDPCRAAHAANVRRQRAQRALQEPPQHGLDSTYLNWRCRCPDCRNAHRQANLAYYHRTKAS